MSLRREGGGGGTFRVWRRRRRRRRRKLYSKLTQGTRRTPSATALPRCRRRDPPYYVPEGDSPLSLHATVSGRVVLSFVRRRRRRRRRKVYSKLTQ